MLVPGFMAGDASLRPLALWLRDLGYRPCRAGMRVNVDCMERAVTRLELELERLAAQHERRVTIIGQSRGGAMARVLAVRHPELVDGIVCLGSPLRDQLAVHPLVKAHVRAVAALGTLGVPGLFSLSCRSGCCAHVDRDLRAPFPDGVGFVSVFSRTDGIVDWRTCLDPAAEQHAVRSSHCGMAVNADVWRILATVLPRPAQPPAALAA
jgi:pimeloyl-ACP methyl ester carboxylesterase